MTLSQGFVNGDTGLLPNGAQANDQAWRRCSWYDSIYIGVRVRRELRVCALAEESCGVRKLKADDASRSNT